MKFGQFEIRSFVEQRFRLDGGGMFGVVPKIIWQKLMPADENNLIPMATNIFVLKAHGKNYLFDVGLGDALTDLEKKIYNTDGNSAMESGLASLDLTTADIDVVLPSHLHTDHAGGVCKLVDGEYRPRFENARYIFCREEWQAAMNPNERTKPVYAVDRLRVLKEAGQLDLIDANTEIVPGLNVKFTGGHSEGHWALEMESEGEKVFFYGDIYPTRHHMRGPYVLAYDVFPLQSLEVKNKKLPEIIADGVIMAYDHDPDVPFARIKQDGRKLIAEPVNESLEHAATKGPE